MRVLSAFFSIGLLSAIPVISQADTLVPAGSLVQCTISEPNLSSKTVEVGDPILCYASSAGYGRTGFPSGAWLSGRFEDYKDPGHFVGKGWMQLSFDRVLLGSDSVIPISAKVVHVPGINVDRKGRIVGHGHAVRDSVEWMIPVLWPEKVITLPMRGPRPRLKQETRLTLKLMDDVLIPSPITAHTSVGPSRYWDGTAPQQQFRIRPQSVQPRPFAPRIGDTVSIGAQQPKPAHTTAKTSALLILKNGDTYVASAYWLEGNGWLRFVSTGGASAVLPVNNLDLPTTITANQRLGVKFVMRSWSDSGAR